MSGSPDGFGAPENLLSTAPTYGWASPSGNDPNTGIYPLAFDAPDFALHLEVALPALVMVQIAAFAHTLSAFRSTEEFHATERFRDFGSRFFIPSGTFTPNGGAIDPPRSEAIFSGHVIEVERRANQFTGSAYFWAKVETYGGAFDVVADPEVVEGPLVEGGVVAGSFWLSGRLVGKEADAHPSSVSYGDE